MCRPAAPPGVGRDEMERYRAPALDRVRRVVAALPGAVVWDPMPELCGALRCEPYRDGRPLFFDGDHLSAYGNAALEPSFRGFVAPLWRAAAP